MSRLDSFIRRLEAQRACLDATPAWIEGLAGPILELGLGNGRTYDHLRGLHPDREIFVFERQPAAHPDCVPDAAHLILGDIRATLPAALEPAARTAPPWSTTTSAPATPTANAELASWIAAALPPLTKPGARGPLRPAARPIRCWRHRRCRRRFPRVAISYTVVWVDPLGAEMRRAARLVAGDRVGLRGKDGLR